MKPILLILTFLTVAFSFSQNNVISGVVNDSESNSEPLVLAKVTIKETGAETRTNEFGEYSFKDLAQGHYTVVFSFIGYESIEKPITVSPGTVITENAFLSANTLGLDELMAVLASADNGGGQPSATNN